MGRRLLDRRVVLIAILLLVITTAIGLITPQGRDVPGSVPASPTLALGLSHVFSGWWFRVIVTIVALQLLLATARLLRRDLRRVLRMRGPAARSPFGVVDPESLHRRLRAAWYVRVRTSPRVDRYVRDVWGYAGPGLLHAGMAMTVITALAVSLTTSAGVLTLSEGATVSSASTLEDVREGPLASGPLLVSALRLDRLDVTYWSDGRPRRVAGTYSLISPGETETIVASTNAPVVAGGLRVFQDPRVGYGYGLTLRRGDVVVTPRLTLLLPESADQASYADLDLENGDLLRAKVTHDPAAADGDPILTLRLVRQGKVIGEQSFDGPGTGALGDTQVSVDIATRWSIVSLERSGGMGFLFASFFVILLGAVLIYAATPRELTLVKHEDGTMTADWHAVRFARLYANEERMLREAASGEKEGSDD